MHGSICDAVVGACYSNSVWFSIALAQNASVHRAPSGEHGKLRAVRSLLYPFRQRVRKQLWEGTCHQSKTLKRIHPSANFLSRSLHLLSSFFRLDMQHSTLNTATTATSRLSHFFFLLFSSAFSSGPGPYLRHSMYAYSAASHQHAHSVDHPSAQQVLPQLPQGHSKVETPKKPFRGDTSGEAPGRDTAAFDSYGPLGVLLGVGLFFVFLRVLLSLPS